MKIRTLCLMALAVIVFSFTGNTFAQSQNFNYSDSWSKHGVTVKESKTNGMELVYSINQFSISDVEINSESMQTIQLSDALLPNDAGAPDLPGFGKYIAIPVGAQAELEIVNYRKEVIPNINLAPAMEIPKADYNGPIVYEKNADIFEKDAFYPAQPFKLSENKKFRGVDIVVLGITPYQYNPVTKELVIYRDVELRINFKGGNGQFGDNRLRSIWFEPMYQQQLLNYNVLPKTEYSKGNLDEDGYEYLIITPDDPIYTAWADTIKNFRTLQGIKTGIVTTTEIGGNTTTAIENYINNAYNTWTVPPVAVLFMGDYGTSGSTINSPTYDSYCISDNLYADVDGDHLPDMAHARMTARDNNELQTMVYKFLHYEQNPPTDADFYEHPITALGWQTERWFQICSETVGGFLKNEKGKDPVRINAIYDGNPNSDPWSTATNTSTVLNYFGPSGQGYIPATPAELGGWSGGTATGVVNAINAGAFMLQHRDHGGETGWGEPAFSNSNINSLTNVDNKLPYIFSINCLTGKFNYSSECFAEKFHRYTYNGEPSGCMGIMAATEVSYSFVNDAYVWGLYDFMWPEFMPDYNDTAHQFNPTPITVTPAFANVYGKHFLDYSSWPYNTSNKEVTYYLFHHHGDAFSTIYTEVPQNLTVIHDPAILSSLTQVTVTADENSFIAFTANGEIIGRAIGTGSPVAVTIEPQLPGTNVIITITKQDYYRYSATVPVIPPSGAYIVGDSAVVNDPLGNNNGQIDYGETVNISLRAKNVGLADATNVSLTISTTSEYVTVIDGTETYGDISAEDFVFIENAFQISVLNTIPDNYNINFSVVATDGDSTWNSYFSLKAKAPMFEIGEMYVTNEDLDPNGRLDPGENADLIFYLENTGHAQANAPTAELLAESIYFTVNNPSVNLNPIAAQTLDSVVFHVSANSNTINGTVVDITFKVTEVVTDSVLRQITIGQPPVIVIGTGTEESTYYPFYTYYENNKSQMLYLGSEFGGGSMLIQEIGFDFSTLGGEATVNNMTINFKETDLTALGTTYPDMTGATTVFSETVYTMPTATGWHNFDIDDFNFNSTDNNLIVEIIWGDNGAWSSAYEVYCTSTAFTSVTYGYADSETPPVYDGNSMSRPNMTFYFAGQTPDTLCLVTFTVLDSATSSPLADATVTVGSLAKDVDEFGQVDFELVQGDYTYTAACVDHDPKTVNFTVSDTMEITVILANSVGISQINMGQFKLYPNPATDMITLESDTRILDIKLYGFDGKLIEDVIVNSNKFELPLYNVENGMYMLQIRTSEGVKTHKIQIVK